ncbi:MAG: type III secretion system chaperone [Puniceicoccales bacterium]|jgi:hypothetical protein|nr:type III secretion system chaperone [Puniceicoccales bacterium]
MDYKIEVDTLLHKLGKTLDLPKLALDAYNRCILIFDEKIVLNVELDEVNGILIVYSYVSVVPFEGRERIFEMLLEANFFWKDSGEATLSIDKQTQTVVMARRFELPLKESCSLEDSLGEFIDNVEIWSKKLEGLALEAETLGKAENLSKNQVNQNRDKLR